MALTDKARRLLRNVGVLVALVAAFFGLRYAGQHGYGRKYLPSFVVGKINLDNSGPEVSLAGTAQKMEPLPSSTPANLPNAPEVRINFWAWNAQMGCLYANGGPVTTEGSLVAKQGIKVTIDRQDDNTQLQAQLTNLAKALHGGDNNPSEGVHFVGIMGDGAAQFLAPLNQQLEKAFGPDYRAEIVGSCGYSRGEDKLMGPSKWKSDPQSLRGALVAGVVRDGDWNIAMRYAADNNIPNNPDETTYDPQAINWVNAKDYVDAAQKYVAGYCEDRPIVTNGKPTGAKKNVCVEGAVTWTPGDVIMAKQKGGVVSVVSTKEYQNEMPHVLIGIHKWNQLHKDVVVKLLTAFAEGGDQVLTYPQALNQGAQISQQIYKEANADASYWKKYYIGTHEADKTGMTVDLGGSKANNLADELVLFGLAPGTSPNNSRFHATYTVFGNLVSKMYPKLLPSVPPTDSILDLSYLRTVQAGNGSQGGKAELATYTKQDSVTDVVGKRAVSITFATGSSQLTAEGRRQVQQLLDELTLNNLHVELRGHTDNTGNVNGNQQLSEERAMAVKSFLESQSPTNFPEGRITARGLGSTQPVASNSNEAGRAKNRRVEIIIGS